MQWHYELEGKPNGPVPDAELDRLFTSGEIRPDTLIWREGMAGWAPYRTARGGTEGPPPLAGYETCSRCGTHFPTSELIQLGGGRVCANCKPIVLQGLREGVGPGEMLSDGLWREGKVLVMNKDASLPLRCVKCGEAVNELNLKRKLTWHTPWVYALLLVNVLVYLVVAIVLRKRATITVGLCERHRNRRRGFIIAAWVLLAVGIGLLVVGFSTATTSGALLLSGFFTLIAAMVVGIIAARVVVPKRISKERVWLAGVHVSLLEPLPEWDGGTE